ncbi:MAG: DUF4143 domain-containing protein [Propionibacteriaceae bacterium]|jgi:predicted AAA+ superfamily ATPase|nr:DUF4143 domain-containing protein [Propionibacteriaceae bacterium]
MSFVSRPIAQKVLESTLAKVAIIEGARAVGKTTMVRQEFAPQGFSYQSLANRSTLALAQADVEAWVDRLPLPAVVDEAQLIPELPLAVKERVDTLPAGLQIILTGSASIGRKGLGGADPLARRSRRYTLCPLTGWELQGRQMSLVDWLFEAPLTAQSVEPMDESSLIDVMSIGGFPDYALARPAPSAADMVEAVRSDVTGLLTDTVLPATDFSAQTARAVLDSLLRTPGGIFNASRVGQMIGADRRTVDRYLGILTQLFLIHWLPNLTTAASRQSHSRAKVHPVDSSFAVASLRASGHDLAADRESFGQVLESWVVNEILASAGWSKRQVRAHYWRDAATSREVDLVLSDEAGRRVGVEVKASRVYDSSQLRGIRTLQKSGAFHRGFIIYLGSEVFPLDQDICLIPASVVWRGL